MYLKKIKIFLLIFALLTTIFNFGAVSQENIVVEYEPKVFANATIDQDFCGKTVLVVMDKNVGGVDKRHRSSFFGDFPIKEIRDLTPSLEKIVEADSDLRKTLEEEGVNVSASQRNMETFRQILAIELPINDKQNVLDVIAQLEKVDGIVSAEPSYYRYPASVPTDPYYRDGNQWALGTAAAGRISVSGAWAINTGSNVAVKVGILDMGVREHPDLRENLETEQNFYNPDVYTNHGTQVAGVIGARWNDIGITGVAQNVKLVSLKTDYQSSATINAINYAGSVNIPILNASYGGKTFSNAEHQAVADYPGLFVASAGNSGTNNDATPYYPASYNLPNIISVGANDSQNFLSQWPSGNSSSYGVATVHLFAPGSNIFTTSGSINTYIRVNGTSFAAPHVTGVAALILSKYPNLNTKQVKWAILAGVDKVADLRNLCTSSGRLNAHKALLKAGELNAKGQSETIYGIHYIRSKNNERYLNLSGSSLSLVTLKQNIAAQRFVVQKNAGWFL